jgi:tetratricopeptide (TPR) repeat protein
VSENLAPLALPPAPSRLKRIVQWFAFNTAIDRLRTLNQYIARHIGSAIGVSATTAARLVFAIEFGLIVTIGFSTMQIDEYFASIMAWLLLATVWAVKALAWNGINNRPKISWILRIIHLLFALLVCASLVAITVVRKGDKDWSNLQRPIAAALSRMGKAAHTTWTGIVPSSTDGIVANAHFQRGLELENDGELDKAIAEYKEAITSTHGNTWSSRAQTYNHLGKDLLKIGFPRDRSEAIVDLETARDLDPSSKSIGEDFDKAIHDFQDEPVVHFITAEQLWKNGDRSGAMAEYKTSCDLPPHVVPYCDYSRILTKHWSQIPADRVQLANWLAGHGDSVGAEEECREAIRLGPNYAGAHLCLGSMLSNTDKDAAKAEFSKAIELDPDDPGAEMQMGTVLLNSGEKQSAVKHFKKSCQLAFDKGDAGYCYSCKQLTGEVSPKVCH